jgi:hypothetical protein
VLEVGPSFLPCAMREGVGAFTLRHGAHPMRIGESCPALRRPAQGKDQVHTPLAVFAYKEPVPYAPLARMGGSCSPLYLCLNAL